MFWALLPPALPLISDPPSGDLTASLSPKMCPIPVVISRMALGPQPGLSGPGTLSLLPVLSPLWACCHAETWLTEYVLFKIEKVPKKEVN